jgi:hypothetical protein
MVDRLHVTVLSSDEELEFGFIAQSQARLLGVIKRDCVNEEIDRLSRLLVASRIRDNSP